MSKTRMGKRVASLLLSLVMMFSLLPTTVYAEGADTGDTTDAVVEETIAPVNAEGVDAVAQEAESSGDEQPDGADNVTSSAVAKIGDKEYATLAGAIADVQDGQTVTLTANVEVADLTLDKTVTIKSEGETQYEIKGLKAIAGTGVTLDNVYLNLTQTLEIGGTNTTLTNCTIRAKDLGYNDVASGEYKSAFGYTNGYSYLTRVTGTNVTMTGCVIDGTDNGDEGYFPNMCLMPTSATNVTIKGCTFNEGWAAIYYGAISGKVEIDSCKFQNIYAYSVNVSEGTDTTVTIKDSTLAGWSSFGSKLNSVTFGNCKFTKELNGYASAYSTVATYTDTVFNNCTFTEDFAGVNTAGNENGVYVDSGAKANVVVEMNGCTVVKNDGSESGKNIKDVLNTDKMGAGTTAVVAIDAVKDANGKYVSGTFVGEKTAITNVIAADSTYDATTGTVTPATTNAVAKIGDTKYASLTEAVAAAKDGATVTLLADAKEDVVINKSITLDLGGKTLTNTNAGKATISVSNGATATVKNGSVVGGTSYYNIEVTKGSNANLTLESVTATAGNTGSSMIDNWGTLTINSGTYTGGLDTVKSEEGSTLTITGGTFTLDYATNGYTAVILVYGDTTITGGEFTQSLTTTGRWNHPQVIATGVVEGYTAITRVTGGRFVNKMSGEGIFRGVGKGTSDNFEVSGGTFNKAISDAFCADGFIPTKNADGTYGVKEGQYVAKVGDKKYETLADAIQLAASGKTVTLLADVTENVTIAAAKKNLTLDLNGYTLNGGTADGKPALLNKGTVTIKDSSANQNGKICREDNGAKGYYVIDNQGTMTIESGHIYNSTGNMPEGSSLIRNAGLKASAILTIKGGDIRQDGFIAIKNDDHGILYISDGTITTTGDTSTNTASAVQNWATAEITGGTINGAIWTSVWSNDLPASVTTIKDATVTGKIIVEPYTSDITTVPTLNIEGGTYTNTSWDVRGNGVVAVSGGTFKAAVPAKYCAEGFIPKDNGDGTYGVKAGAYVAEVNGVKYETLQAAINAAARNATVTMLADTKENVTIDKALTLDLNGFTLNGSTGERKPALTITARTVTIKDSSEAQTGTIMREDTAENSGVSSHYVIDVQDAGWLTFESGNVKNDSGAGGTKGASLVRVGDDSVSKFPGLNIKGGTFTQDNFIVIKVDRGDLFLNGGTLNSKNSYAIEDWHRATIKGGTVNGTVAAWTYSGGHNSSLEISGGTVNGNVESVSYDGAEGKLAKVKITGGTVNGTLSTKRYNSATEPTKDMATIEITGGTFSSDPTKYVVEDSAVTKNEDNTFGVAKAYLAKVGETSYYTMEDAFEAQTASGEAIVLLRDYTTGSTFNSGTVARVVDLGRHTWTCTGTDANSAAFEINNPNASLTVKNGKIVSSQLVGLIPSAMGGSIKYDNSSLTFENVEMSTTATSGIETNGNNTNDTVTLRNSTLNVPNGFGIYFPSSGTLTIENSKINAKTMGVQVCSGSLSINAGSAITVSGDAVPKTENDGAIQDGAAISIVNRTGYKGLGTVTVSGGKFTAKEGNSAIKAYNWADKTETDFTANDKVSVSGGSFSSAVPEGLCKDGYIPVANDDGTHTVKEGKYVAEYNGTKYTSLQEAIDAAVKKSGMQTVTLLGNLTIAETVNFAKASGGALVLNLGNYTLTGEGCRALQINQGYFYLENGTVTSTGIVNSSSVIRVGSNETTYNNSTPTLYMRNGAKVLAPVSYGVTIFGSATANEKLTVADDASIVATGDSPAISGNGGANYHKEGRGSTIIITGDARVSATNNYAIYHPDNGTLKIQGNASVSGKGGIQMCSGTLEISYGSPTIKALGQADHETGAAGPIYDVAAISVVNRSYPGGAPVVTIKGTPTVTANEGEVIHAYTWSNNAESVWADAGNNINVSGGTYSKTFNTAYLAADCTLVASGEMYTVEQKPVAEYNGTQYTSLPQAILDANNSEAGGTVKLLENVKLTSDLGIGGSALVTLDLGEKTLTLDGGAQIFTKGTANTNITNGTIERIDTPTANNSSDFAIQINSGNMMTLGTSLYSKVTINAPYGIYVIGGKLNARYTAINTNGWSIAVNDSATKTGEVEIGLNATTKITSQSGNCIGTAVNSKPNVTIHKGTLTSNGTDWDAGVIYWASEGTLTIEGGTFTASSAEGSEAAAVYQKNGTVKISGATTKLLGNNALVVKDGDGSTGEMVTELSGGTYSTKPDEAWVVEGKEIHETDKGYKVEGPYVVEVTLENGTVHKFDSWSKAFYSTEAQEHNATVKLLTDIETTSTVTTWATVTVDFNGHTLTVNGSGVAAITALTKGAAANVTLMDSVGNGGMVTTGVYGVTVKGSNTTLTVESGNYNCYTSVVQVEKPVSGVATAYIKGGTFQTEDAVKSYLLNCIDEAFKDGTAKMEVTGGTFYGFDPSANPEGENTTYVKAGYVSNDNGDGTYTVEEYKPVEVWTGYTGTKVASYATIKEAVANLGNNKWIVIAKDYTLDEDFTIPTGVFLDVASGATLTVAEGTTLTVAADAKRLGVRTGATLENNGTIMVLGTSGSNGYVMVQDDATFDVNTLSVREDHFLDNNGSNYFATANANALYEITYTDGTVKKTADSPQINAKTTQVKLLKDVEKGSWVLSQAADNFILDLGGKTLSGSSTSSYYLLYTGVNMTIKNGTIKYNASNKGAICVYNGATVTIDSTATIDGGSGIGIMMQGETPSHVVLNGTVKTTGEYGFASNGSENADGKPDTCNITVSAGAKIEAPNGFAIYHPTLGTVTINGGEISGHTGIEMCAGKLVVSGGSITSTGDNWNATGSQNAILDGAAISLINRNYPGGTPTAEITGGTFTATGTGAQTVKAYDYTNNEVAEWKDAGSNVNISGGTFSSIPDNMAALCKVGFRAVENKDNNVYIVKEGKYVIEVTSRIQGTDQTVATPTGGGQAAYGEEVTVTTYAVTGFTFLGWYDGEGKQLSTKDDMTYTHKVTGDCTLIAKYAQDSTRMFRLTVNGTVFTVNERTEYAHHYSELASGSRVTIMYTGTDNFLYWVNASKNVVTTSKTLEYTMVNDAEFTAVTAPATSDSAIVVFKNNIERGQELQARRYYNNETIVFPATPSSYGKTFAYWAILDADGNILKDEAGNAVVATESAIKAKIAEGGGYIVVAAVYTANGHYKATAHFVDSKGTKVADDMVNANVPTGSGWQVTAPDVEKKFFSYWKDAAENVLSTSQTYTIYAMDAVEVTAVYVDNENDKHATMNTVKLTALTRVVGNSHDLGLVAQYDVASGKTINRVGILFTTNANYKDSLTLENENALKSTPLDNPKSNSNVYRHWLNGINNLSAVVYARAYVTTTDGETIYSEVIEGSFNSWNGN